ncbi:MAG: hypothetical protein IJU80_10130 [Lachnospiraceae bacterium]|nr:hypothetical protein [Lachnospiraceae bacterium]
MSEYFRQEKITLQYMPIFLCTRALFLVLMIWLPAVQVFIMLMAASFSYGFRNDTEIEHMLPLSDEELKRMRLERGTMIWMRYLLVALLGSALAFLLPKDILFRGELFEKPLVYGAFFLLEMAMIYETLMERFIKNSRKNYSLFRFVFCSIPTICLFTYAFSSMSFHKFMPVFMEGAEWIHALILLTATALMAIYCGKLYRDWKLSDYHQDAEQAGKQKGNGRETHEH